MELAETPLDNKNDEFLQKILKVFLKKDHFDSFVNLVEWISAEFSNELRL